MHTVLLYRSRQLMAVFPGVAKFGIALEWGSRGLEFESRHSDQIKQEPTKRLVLVLFFLGFEFKLEAS